MSERIYKYRGDIQKVFTRKEKKKNQQCYENPIRKYEKWNFAPNKANIVPITVKKIQTPSYCFNFMSILYLSITVPVK